MEGIKPCVRVTQKERARIAAEGSLRGNGDSFTEKKVVKCDLESGLKIATVSTN